MSVSLVRTIELGSLRKIVIYIGNLIIVLNTFNPYQSSFVFKSREMPMQLKSQRKANLVASVEEVDQHIKKLVERYGAFAYPPVRTPYNPLKEDEQLQTLIPG